MKPGRSLQTILFTDIVGSTERATELGDRRWRKLLRRHDSRVRAQLRRFLGAELNTAGDGFVATFDEPVRAILCAAAIRDSLDELELPVRCGLHMGQVEGAGAEASGIAVHIGARTASEAGAGEILVSRSVRDSVEGSGFRFEDLGARELKGVQGEWRLFRVTGLPEDTPSLAPGWWQRTSHAVRRRRAVLAATGALFLGSAFGYLLLRPGPPLATAGSVRSMAVLPLENLSGDPEQEYFADGMTEALITELSKIGAIQVISRTSAMRYKGSDKTLPEIADELGVAGMVEGSVVRVGDRVRITAQLIHAGTDTHLWAESFEGDITDVLRLQGEVARAIARRIEVALTPEEEARLAANRPVDPESYEAYLKGTFHLNKLTPEGIERGLGYLHEAVEKDPASALAYAGLALGYGLVASHSPDPPPNTFQRAQAAYRKALELDETLAEAHAAVAETKLYGEWDWEGAERSFRRALELNPSLPRAHAHYAFYLNLMGRQEEALAEMRRAVQLDPLDPLWTTWIGDLHMTVGDHDEVIVAARKGLEIDPDFPWALHMLGIGYDGNGMHEEAMAAHRKAAALDPGFRWGIAFSHATAGHEVEARRIAAELEADPRNGFALAIIYGVLGDRDRALRWIEASFEARHPFTPWLFRAPHLDFLREDPLYRDIMDRMNLEPLEEAALAKAR